MGGGGRGGVERRGGHGDMGWCVVNGGGEHTYTHGGGS